MKVKSKNIFKKILLPVIEIVVVFAILSFAISYYSIDRFVKAYAKEKIEEAYDLVKEKRQISHTLGTQVYVYDNDFNDVFIIEKTTYSDKELLTFIQDLLINFEIEEDRLMTIMFNRKEYLAKMYDAGPENKRGRYYVVLQELTNRVDLMKENFGNVFILQLLVLFVVGIIVYNIQSRNEKEAKKQKTIYENVAHDLRTPLVSILGYADGLKSGIIKDKDKACDIILKTGNQLKEMIENILVLSRFDNENYKILYEDIDIRSLIDEQVETLKFIDNNISIEVINNLNDYSIIRSDKKLFTRIIQNLLSNALKYASSKIEIIVNELPFDKSKHQKLEIIIADDGEGIKNENIEQVFERYYKGSDGHFGIGLAVVKSSLEFLSGKIFVEKNSPKGTRFVIHI